MSKREVQRGSDGGRGRGVINGGLALIRLCGAEPGFHLASRCWTGGESTFQAVCWGQRSRGEASTYCNLFRSFLDTDPAASDPLSAELLANKFDEQQAKAKLGNGLVEPL